MIHSFSAYRRALATALALLILSAQMASSAAQTSPAFDRALEKGEALMEEGNYRAAIRAFKKAEKLSLAPSLPCVLGLARSFIGIGDFKKAQANARTAVELAQDPYWKAIAHNRLGVSLFAGGRASADELREAERAFRQALVLSQGELRTARFSLAAVLVRLERDYEAVALLHEFLSSYPNSPEANRALFLIGHASLSVEDARKAVQVSQTPSSRAIAYSVLGRALLNGVQSPPSKQRIEEAEGAIRTALEISEGQLLIAWYDLGRLHLHLQGRREEARTAFAEYLARAPDGYLSDQVRGLMDWIVCAQAVGGLESQSNENPATSSDLELIGPLRVEGDVEPPVKVFASMPDYNLEARRARIEGAVVIQSVIDREGAVRCVNVLKGLPEGLTEAATNAVTQWKFEPATLHGEPVAVIYNLTVNFRLK